MRQTRERRADPVGYLRSRPPRTRLLGFHATEEVLKRRERLTCTRVLKRQSHREFRAHAVNRQTGRQHAVCSNGIRRGDRNRRRIRSGCGGARKEFTSSIGCRRSRGFDGANYKSRVCISPGRRAGNLGELQTGTGQHGRRASTGSGCRTIAGKSGRGGNAGCVLVDAACTRKT